MSSDSPSAIRCVAFDAVGTLIEASPTVADAYSRVGRLHGSCRNSDDVSRRLEKAISENESRDLADEGGSLVTSEAIERKRWRWIVGEVFDDVDDFEACFDDLFEYFGRASSWRCFGDVGGAVARVAEQGLDFVIASNFDARLHGVCAGLPGLVAARSIVVSSEVGCRKPGRIFYDAVVEAAGCAASEILMVGDDPANDYQGALRCGLQASRIDRTSTEVSLLQPSRRPQVVSSLLDLEAWY
ncbi:MAG: HAD-IA family hydrolase [Planctomycetaceae bacterium]|nr:HAD-IA family hydrolase [Planctomycetaceae bacterium]